MYAKLTELTIDEAVKFLGLGRDTLRIYAKRGIVSRQKKVRLCSVQKNIRQRYLYLKKDLLELKTVS